MQPSDEAELRGFLRAFGGRGVHLVCAAGPEGVAAAAVVGKALARAHIERRGLTVLSYGERMGSPPVRAWLADAPALVLVGLHVDRTLGEVPQLSITTGRREPLAERAFRLGEMLAPLGDASWCAAVGLVGRAEPHALVERARAHHAYANLAAIANLLDAAGRGPQPARESLAAAELLTAAPAPRRFLAGEEADALRHTEQLVHAELARATRLRPRPGFGVVVIEYDSACRLEDRVAERWRGLRPGTVVLVANHGAAAGLVAVAARAAVPEALDRLRGTLGDEGTTLLDGETWAQLRQRLGVAPAPGEADSDGAFELSALPN